MMYGTARDLQGCMVDMMQFEEEDVLEMPLLESGGDLPTMFPTSKEEAVLLDEPQEAQVTGTCPLVCEEQCLEPEDAARLGETATEPQVVCLLPPPGFGPAPSGYAPPPLEDN